MSLQDDIFDVRDALKRKSEKKGFDRIVAALNYYETEYDKLSEIVSDLRKGLGAIKTILASTDAPEGEG